MLIEKHFTAGDINRNLFIFRFGLDEIKSRITELEQIMDSSSIIRKLHMDKNSYLKMIEKMITKTNDPEILKKLELIKSRLKHSKLKQLF